MDERTGGLLINIIRYMAVMPCGSLPIRNLSCAGNSSLIYSIFNYSDFKNSEKD